MIDRFKEWLGRAIGREPGRGTAVCGHRGSPGTAPENTLPSFRHAVEAGAELVELDVLLTKDDEPVVMHDKKLDRTTDLRGAVSGLTMAEVRAGDAGAWFTEARGVRGGCPPLKFVGERVPHLRDVLDFLRGRCVPMIEVKERADNGRPVLEKLAAALHDTGTERAAILIWRQEGPALRSKELLPGALSSMIAFTGRRARRAAAVGLDGICPYYRRATARLIRACHRKGLFTAPWTVNHPKDMEFFVRAEADAIMTDHPRLLRELLERHGVMV